MATWWLVSTRQVEAVRLFFNFLGRPSSDVTCVYIGTRGTTMTKGKKRDDC